MINFNTLDHSALAFVTIVEAEGVFVQETYVSDPFAKLSRGRHFCHRSQVQLHSVGIPGILCDMETVLYPPQSGGSSIAVTVSFLDQLRWHLYHRGQCDETCGCLLPTLLQNFSLVLPVVDRVSTVVEQNYLCHSRWFSLVLDQGLCASFSVMSIYVSCCGPPSL